MDTAQMPRQDFDENGYIVIKNVFTEEEIDQIRSATLESLLSRRAQGKGFTSDKNASGEAYFGLPELLSVSELAELDYVALHPKITNLIKKLIAGPGCYFEDSTAQIGTGDRGLAFPRFSRHL